MNPSSFISIDVVDSRFKWLYGCYGACVEGFRTACIPLLFLDGTFLKDCYKGTFLVATAYNDNNRLFPLAFCVCNIEDEGKWD